MLDPKIDCAGKTEEHMSVRFDAMDQFEVHTSEFTILDLACKGDSLQLGWQVTQHPEPMQPICVRHLHIGDIRQSHGDCCLLSTFDETIFILLTWWSCMNGTRLIWNLCQQKPLLSITHNEFWNKVSVDLLWQPPASAWNCFSKAVMMLLWAKNEQRPYNH